MIRSRARKVAEWAVAAGFAVGGTAGAVGTEWVLLGAIIALTMPATAFVVWDLVAHGWRERFPQLPVVAILCASVLATLTGSLPLQLAGVVGAFLAVFALGVNAWSDEHAGAHDRS